MWWNLFWARMLVVAVRAVAISNICVGTPAEIDKRSFGLNDRKSLIVIIKYKICTLTTRRREANNK